MTGAARGRHVPLGTALAALVAIVAGGAGRSAIAAPVIPAIGKLSAGGGEVAIDAAQIDFDQRENVVTARGAVKITRGDMVLTADTVRVYRGTQVAEAEGNVVLTDPQGSVTADAMTLNLVEETGTLDNGAVLFTKSRYYLTGRRFEKLPGQSYQVAGGAFTTCLCGAGEPPSWSVRGEHITVDLDGYGKVENGTFRVMDVPILYVPYGLFPVKRERQTGFLVPRFGYSNRRGVQIEQPFYVALNKSMDATVSVDVETAARIGVLGEYRYALSPTTLGELQASYFNEQIRGASSEDVVNQQIADPNVPVNRWSVGFTHDQWLPWDVRGFADVFRVSDDLFLREINVLTFNPGVDVALRTRRFERSRVGAIRLFDHGLVMSSATWYQDFINDDDFDFQIPPRIEGLVQEQVWDDRIILRFAGEGANFQRDQGFEGQRLDLRPEIEIPWRVAPYVFGSWRGGFRETAYTLNDTTVPEQVNINPADPGSQPPSILPDLNADATRELFYVHGEAGTSVSRVMPFDHFGLTRLKHTIEPTVEYLYLPRTDTRQAALPLFDDVDRINHRSVFTYGVTSRLLGRSAAPAKPPRKPKKSEKPAPPPSAPVFDAAPAGTGDEVPEPERDADSDGPAGGDLADDGDRGVPAGPIRELARLSLFQSYDVVTKGGDFIDEVDENGQVKRGPGDHASDVAALLRLTPADFLTFEGRTDYSVTGEGAKGASIYLSLADPRTPSDEFTLATLRGRSRIGIGYRFVAGSAVREVNAGLLLRITKQFYAAYETRYDALSSRFLENRFGLRFISACECWVVDLAVTDRVNPNETQVSALVSLVGLAQFGKEPFRNSLGAIAAPVQSALR